MMPADDRVPSTNLRRRRKKSPKGETDQADEETAERSGWFSAAPLFSSERRLWAFSLAFRAANALLVQTYFNPDEHWQSLEVAHRIVFGYGHLTWEWKKGIRGYLHPLIFALLYKVLALLGLDTPWIMVKAPRLLQSVFASFGDLYLYKLSKLIFNEHVARWAFFCQLANWFMFFSITRTLSNSLETVLTTIGIFYWFSATWSSKQVSVGSRKIALFIAALTCAIRPTSAIIWLYVGFLDLVEMQSKFIFLLFEVIPIGALVLSVSCILDWWMYGSKIIVPLNFLKFNFLSSGGDYYGTHVWHWYFTQGFPPMVSTFLPFSLMGIFKSKEWRVSGLILWVLGVYSVLGHKEFRFVLPVLPLTLLFSGYSLVALSNQNTLEFKKSRSSISSKGKSWLNLVICFLLLTNVPMAIYMSFVHQRGSEDVMFYLSKEAHDGKVQSILFLTPCHATPYYSMLHYNLPMRFLDCTPSDNKGILDESDRFMRDPTGFVKLMFLNSSFPSHIVMFDSQEIYLMQLLHSLSFKEVKRFFHAHFKVDRDLQAAIAVYARQLQ